MDFLIPLTSFSAYVCITCITYNRGRSFRTIECCLEEKILSLIFFFVDIKLFENDIFHFVIQNNCPIFLDHTIHITKYFYEFKEIFEQTYGLIELINQFTLALFNSFSYNLFK